jgi:hypothetical protein
MKVDRLQHGSVTCVILQQVAELADECFVQYRLVAETNLSEAGIRGAE